MSVYRIYFLEQLSGHISHYIEFETGCDTRAIKEAKTHIGHHRIDLWGNRRKVWSEDAVSSVRRAPARVSPDTAHATGGFSHA